MNKLVLSRKGFDSSFGGCASPIFEDGSLVSLPIPHWFKTPAPTAGCLTFGDVGGEPHIGGLVNDLTRNRSRLVSAADPVHLDPDIRQGSMARVPGWRPLFGQSDQAQRHLENQSVEAGDLFLFFGWFRRVIYRDGHWWPSIGEPDLHVLYGWLRVGEVWRVGKEGRCKVPRWAQTHPHAMMDFGQSNTIYAAATTGDGYDAGTFGYVTDDLVLTVPGSARRTYWRLPRWFHPEGRRSTLTYHCDLERWRRDDDYAYLATVGRGQEFVLDTADYPEAVEWSQRLVEKCRIPRDSALE